MMKAPTPGSRCQSRRAERLEAVARRGRRARFDTGVDASETIEELLVRYGVAEQAELTERSTARTDLRGLRELAGEAWTIPPAVYEPMRDWKFDAASSAIGTTSMVIGDVTATAVALPDVDVSSNPLHSELAEADTSADLRVVEDRASAQHATADGLAAAMERAHTANPIDAIGLIGTDMDAMSADAIDKVAQLDLAAAHAGTDAIDAAMDGATGSGLFRIGAVFAAALAVAWLWRRRRADRVHTDDVFDDDREAVTGERRRPSQDRRGCERVAHPPR